AEVAYRRGGHGGPVLGASGRAGRARAENRAVRFRTAKSARSDPGTAGQAYDLLLACHAAEPRAGRQKLREFQGGIFRPDHRMFRTLLPKHDEQKHTWAIRLHRPRVHSGTIKYPT